MVSKKAGHLTALNLPKLETKGQRGAASRRLKTSAPRVDGVSSVGYLNPHFPHLSGRRSPCAFTDPSAPRPPLLRAASRSLCSSYAPQDPRAVRGCPRAEARKSTARIVHR